jgi:AcrR family transcriptional regulator
MMATAREMARERFTEDIVAAATRQLAEVGAAALSLRSVARELGVASSAVYRYVPSRDALLTELILRAYRDLGAAATAVERERPREDHAGRFRAIAGAIRDWARAHPHRYALIFGSPVPGYAAPRETVAAATIATMLLVNVLQDAHGGAPDDDDGPGLERGIAQDIGYSGPMRYLTEGIRTWSETYGLISFELFGHLVGSVADADVFFAAAVDAMVGRLGLAEA